MRRVSFVLTLACVAVAGGKEDAWTAHRAGAGDADALRAMLGEGRAVRWVLDALVRIGAQVPAREIAPHVATHPGASIVLLSRLGDDAVPVLRRALAADLTDAQWMAACNLLAERKAPGLAAALLAELELTLELLVLPGRNAAIGLGGGAGGGVVAKERPGAPAPDGYPPAPVLLFTDDLRTGDVVVAPGRRVIAVQRAAAPAKVRRVRTSRAEFRCLLLNQMYGGPPYRDWVDPITVKTIYWEGDDDYVQRGTKARDAILQNFEILVNGLNVRGLLTDDEAAAARPRLKIRGKWMGFGKGGLPEIPAAK